MSTKFQSILIISFLLFISSGTQTFAQYEDSSLSESQENKKVTAIEVQGNKTISIATILSKIKTRVGNKRRP